MNWLKRRPFTVLLGIACLVAAFGLGLEYRLLQRFLADALKPPPAAQDAPRTPQPPPAPAELPPMETFSAFVDRPLFVEGRKPLPEEAETAADARAEQEPPKFRLTGIIVTPETGQILLLQDPSNNKTLRFKPEELIDGWRVAELKDDQVVLQRGGQTQILKLIKPRPLPPPAARPHPPQGQAINPFAQAANQKPQQ
ncbi:hypothetical protein JCM13664_00750 [Methylothermus subterraneus]